MSSRSRSVNTFPEPIPTSPDEIDQRWRSAIEQYARTLEAEWAHFDSLVSVVDGDLGGEVTEDDAGDLFSAFTRLRRLGVRFDPTFIERFVEQMPDTGRNGCMSESFAEDGNDGDEGQDDGYCEVGMRSVQSDDIKPNAPLTFAKMLGDSPLAQRVNARNEGQ